MKIENNYTKDNMNQFITNDLKTTINEDKELVLSNEDSVWSICTQCPYSTISIQQLESHMEKCHGNNSNVSVVSSNDNGSSVHSVSSCDMTLPTPMHTNSTPTKLTLSTLPGSDLVRNSEDKLNVNPINFVNSITAEVQSKLANLKSNTLVSDSRRRYRCSICPVTFPWHGDLAAHMSEMHGFQKSTRDGSKSKAGSYKCSYCMYVAKYQSELKRHRRLHMGVKPFGCVFCKYRSAWKGDLKRHIESHHRSSFTSEEELAAIMSQYKNNAGTELKDDAEKARNQVSSNDALESDVSSMNTSPEKPVNNEDSVLNLSINKKKTGDDKPIPDSILSIKPNFPITTSNQFSTPMFPNFLTPHTSQSTLSLPTSFSSLPTPFLPVTTLANFLSPPPPPSNLFIADFMKGVLNLMPPNLMNSSSILPCRNIDYQQRSINNMAPINLSTTAINTTSNNSQVILTTGTASLPTIHPSNHSTEPQTTTKISIDHIPIITPTDTKSGPSSSSTASLTHSLSHTNSNNTSVSHQEHWKRFKCSGCGHRSNWKWDINKHIKVAHPERDGITTLELTFEEAKSTLQAYLNSSKANKSRCHNSFESEEGYYRPYKCSACGHRSNWKWDVNKHIKQVHLNQAEVITLTMEEAKRTISLYKRRRRSTTNHNSLPQDSMVEAPVSLDSSNTCISLEAPSFPVTNEVIEETNTTTTVTTVSEPVTMQDRGSNPRIDSLGLKRLKCSECGYRSNYRSDISRHIRKKHAHKIEVSIDFLTDNQDLQSPKTSSMSSPQTSRKLWQCHVCEYKAKEKIQVSQHITSSHQPLRPFKCRVCNYGSDYRNSLLRHLKSKHKLSPTFTPDDIQELLEQNLSKVKPEKSEDACHKCAQPFFQTNSTSSRQQQLFLHFVEKHANSDEEMVLIFSKNIVGDSVDSTQFQCELCPFKTTHKQAEELHNFQHSDICQYLHKCTICSYKAGHEKFLLNHVSSHFRTTIKPAAPAQPVKAHHCRRCPYFTTNVFHLRVHYQAHHNSRTLTKKTPPSILPNSPNDSIITLYKSINFHDNPELQWCDECGYVCKDEQSLMNHLLKHFSQNRTDSNNNKVISCELCSYQCDNNDEFMSHRITHLLSESTNLLTRAFNHNNMINNDYKCELCRYSTSNCMKFHLHNQYHNNTANNNSQCFQCHFNHPNTYGLICHLRFHH